MILESKERFILALSIILFAIGNIVSAAANILALILIYVYILFTSKEFALYLVFFLIPNIRIVDNVGFTSFINIAFLLVGIKWITKSIYKNNKYGLFAAIIAFVFSISHIGAAGNTLLYLVNTINIVVDIFVMVSIFSNKKTNLDTEKIIRYLTIGVITSMLVYVLANNVSVESVFFSNYRLEGYGDDPNYYSIYTLISISYLLLKIKNGKKNILDIILVFTLVFIGLLTSSKMFFLCLVFVLLWFTLSVLFEFNKKGFKAVLLVGFVGIVAFLIERENIVYLLNKVIKRFSVISNSKTTAIYALTTGRSSILQNYWNIFWNDIITCLFGRGLAYNQCLAPLFGDTRVAHNTYMDLILSWGLVGSISFIACFGKFVRTNCQFVKKIDFIFAPLIVFLATIFSLSCLTADMFWYMLLIVLLPFKRQINCKKETQVMSKNVFGSVGATQNRKRSKSVRNY